MITTPITLPNGEESYKLFADDGKVIVRISDGQIFGTSLVLGYTYYIGGQPLPTPHKETPDEFTEADAPPTQDPTAQSGSSGFDPDANPTTPQDTPPEYGTVSSIIAAIDRYDTSQNVNVFYLNGQPMWIDKATRVGIVNAINATEAIGQQSITLGIGGLSLTIDCEKAKQLMFAIERYALDCYNVTLAHQNAVKRMTDAEAVTYDYTIGYPDKLHLFV